MCQGLGYGHLGGGSCLVAKLIPWNVAYQAPLPKGFPRQENWSGKPLPRPGDLPDQGLETASPALAGRFCTGEPPGKSVDRLGAVIHLPHSQSTVHKWTRNRCPVGQLGAAVANDCHACAVSLLFISDKTLSYFQESCFLLLPFHTVLVGIYMGEGNGTPLQYSRLENPIDRGAWWAAVHGVVKSRTWLSDFTLTFHFHALEKEMATHSSVLAWRIPGTREPGGLQSMGLLRVGLDWHDLAAAAAVGIWVS